MIRVNVDLVLFHVFEIKVVSNFIYCMFNLLTKYSTHPLIFMF
jgi:hypothetical protein